MKITIFLALCYLHSVFGLFGQEIPPKIDKLYKQGKFEKCIFAIEKEEQKEGFVSSNKLQHYKVACYYYLLPAHDHPSYTNSFMVLLEELQLLAAIDKKREYFGNHPLYKPIQQLSKDLCLQLADKEHHSQARRLCKINARVFADTNLLYAKYFPPPIKVESGNAPPDLLFVVEEGELEISTVALDAKVLVLLENIKKHLGKPYVWGGMGEKGFDCSGFVCVVFKELGFSLPHKASLLQEKGQAVRFEELKTGDLICFGKKHHADHVAIVLREGEKLMIAHSVSGGVCVQDFTPESYWGRAKVVSYRRLLN